jgi:hypothetical protein
MSTINAVRARKALARLAVPEAARASLEDQIARGVSFADYVETALGAAAGNDYLLEEVAEWFIIRGERLDPSEITVAEFLSGLEDEPWHGACPPLDVTAASFAGEASEPWHESLRDENLLADSSTAKWFDDKPEWEATSERIRALALEDDGDDDEVSEEEIEDEDDGDQPVGA